MHMMFCTLRFILHPDFSGDFTAEMGLITLNKQTKQDVKIKTITLPEGIGRSIYLHERALLFMESLGHLDSVS